MIDLHISVNNKIATFQKRDGDIVCGNSDYQIKFTFDEEWDAYENKIARFVWSGQFQDVEFTGDTCPVPILSGVTLCEVGVYAGELCTTTSAFIGCKTSILCLPASPSVENDKYYANEARESAEEARKYAEEAKEARDGVASPYIKDGNWWVGETDTGVKAAGDDYVLTDADKEEIAQLALNSMERAEDWVL